MWRSRSRRASLELSSARPGSADSGSREPGADAAYPVQLQLAGLAAEVSRNIPRLESHIFVASKAPWLELRDEKPRFDEHPPDPDEEPSFRSVGRTNE